MSNERDGNPFKDGNDPGKKKAVGSNPAASKLFFLVITINKCTCCGDFTSHKCDKNKRES